MQLIYLASLHRYVLRLRQRFCFLDDILLLTAEFIYFALMSGVVAIFEIIKTILCAFITLPGIICLFLRNRSEEHTSELQSRFDIVCRLLLEKKKDKIIKRK